MTLSLTIVTERLGSTLKLTLSGPMDESANYAVIDRAGVRRLEVDFEAVGLINSTGLQGWVKFVASLPATMEVVFRRCAVRVVSQMNMFPGFTGGRQVKIESFYAPYFCVACDRSVDILLAGGPPGKVLAGDKAPPMSCPVCGESAEFDGIEKKYFLFLSAG